MESNHEIQVTLVPAPAGEGPTFGTEYQAALSSFAGATRPTSWRAFTQDSIDAVGGLVGDFFYTNAKELIAVIGTATAAFIAGRAGRKVRLRVGAKEIEVEARTQKEAEELLLIAEEHRQKIAASTAPAAVHESYWIGLISDQGVKEVERFGTEAEALKYRESVKRFWQIPASITVPFQASTREEALEKMARY